MKFSTWLYRLCTPWLNQAVFIGGDDFIRHAREHRVIYFGGRVGSGKSALACLMSYLFEQAGIVDRTVATMPVAWAVPADLCEPRNFCAILDELGVEMDARSFQDKKQNIFRKEMLAYMRKLNMIAIIASRVSPDVSFRGLTVQRVFSFVPLLPLEVYTYGFEDRDLKTNGYFGLWNRAWLWSGRGHPSAMYGHKYIPDGKEAIDRLIKRAIAEGKSDQEEPNAISQENLAYASRWLRMGFDPAAQSPHGSANGQTGRNSLGEGDTSGESGEVFWTGATENARSGGRDFGV